MSDHLKFIVEHLNKKPFERGYNLISFDSLQSTQLLQVLNDVLTSISNEQHSDVRQEDPEQRVLRTFAFLRVLKYKPNSEANNVSEFRQGLVQGDKHVLYPLLHWLLERLPELTKRAYLGRFLIKLEVPQDMLMDNELAETNRSCLELIEQFKESHKGLQQLKESGYSVADIKKDIVAMEEEEEQLRNRVDRLQRRIDSLPNKTEALHAAQLLRNESEKEANLQEQLASEKSQLNHNDQKIKRLETFLKDVHVASAGITAEGLLKKLQEENQVHSFLCQEKIPKEIQSKEKYLRTLQKIAHEPTLSKVDLEALNSKIAKLSGEINHLVEKHIVSNDPMEDKLSVFRQQAAVISNKKTFTAEKLQELMDEVGTFQEELSKKHSDQRGDDGEGEVLKGEEFKRYVNKLRTKSTLYKKKRAQIAELKAELGVLKRTVEILNSKNDHLQSFISQLESEHGVKGYHKTQEDLEMVSTVKSQVDKEKGKTLEDISQMVLQMNHSVAERRNSLAPLIKELRPLRVQVQEMSVTHKDCKSTYETTSAGLESNLSKLEQEVKGYRDQFESEESRFCYLKSSLELLKAEREKVAKELAMYKSTDHSKSSFREVYTMKIHEQELLGKGLREKQKSIRESHDHNMTQMKMWSDLSKLLNCKLHGIGKDGGITHQNLETPAFEEHDHLVL